MRPQVFLTALVLGLFSSGVRAAPEKAPAADDDEAWAFKAPRKMPPPQVERQVRVVNPIDAFVLARLESRGLSLTTPADRLTLLRRVTLDLIGLPPTIAEQDAFLADKSPDAYAKVVDRLLASERHGEHWAQHWLDLVRYAETDGFKADD